MKATRSARLRQTATVDALYRRYREALTRLLIRRRVNQDEAADIVQDAYCRIHQLPDIETVQFPRAFLFRTALNLATNAARRRKVLDMQAMEEGVEIAAEAPGPYQILKGEQELMLADEAFRELSAKCRRVFVMHRFENRSYAEIAAELGISVSMVEKYVSQALAHLRARLAIPAALGRRLSK